NRLPRRAIDAMIDGVVGNKPLPDSVRQDIIERTDGIPLFVEEMTKAVLEAENASSRTSNFINSACAPSECNCDNADWAFASFLPAITTAAPHEAKPFAMPRPIPPLPPVIKATRFFKLKSVIQSKLYLPSKICCSVAQHFDRSDSFVKFRIQSRHPTGSSLPLTARLRNCGPNSDAAGQPICAR